MNPRCGYPRPASRAYGCGTPLTSWALNRAIRMQKSMDDDSLNAIDKHDVPWTPRMFDRAFLPGDHRCDGPIERACE